MQLRFKLCIGIRCKFSQAARIEDPWIIGQEMIINNIDEGAAVKTVGGSKKFLCHLRLFVTVSKFVNGAMQADPFPDGGWIVVLLPAFYEITDHIASQDSGIPEG